MSKIEERCHENVQPIKNNIMSVLIYIYTHIHILRRGGGGERFYGNVISQV